MTWLTCACCGKGFDGWQFSNRDTGFGICDDAYCTKAYGYNTVGPKTPEALARANATTMHKDPTD